MKNRKGFVSLLTSIALLVIVVGGAFLVVGMVSDRFFGKQGGTSPLPFSVERGATGDGGATRYSCPSGIATLRVDMDARNPLNPVGIWLDSPYRITRSDGKSVLATGTLTQGATKTITTATISCDDDVMNNGIKAIGTGSSSFTSGYEDVGGQPKTLFFKGATSVASSWVAHNTTTITMQWLTTAFVNDTTTANSATITTNAITLASGGSASRILRLLSITSGNQLGDKNILVSIDTVNTTVFADSDIKISVASGAVSLTETSCGNYINTLSARSANRCYLMSPYNSGTGEVDLKVTESASLGEPDANGANPIIYLDDIVTATDAKTGEVITEAFDSALNNLGASNVRATVDND